jgi:diguanylate cyclase (GGDEF)-like protein
MTDSAAKTAHPQTVLVVDDSRVIRKAVNTILANDYTIIEAENGGEALRIIHSGIDIHLILLDLWMPDVDGFEVLEAVREDSNPEIAGLPVIIVTGHEDDAEIRTRAENIGASDFIGKPFSAVELRNNVAHYILPPDRTNVIPFKAGTETTQHTDVASKPRPRTAEEIRRRREEHLNIEGQKILNNALRTRQPISVLRLQVDRVKALLNKTDTEFTKRSLYRIHKAIEFETRHKDLLLRMGPTDFALIMPNTDNNEAKEIGKNIFRVIRHTIFRYGDLKFRMTLSGGLSTPRIDSKTQFKTVLALADVRLERAYNGGGNQIIHDDLATTNLEDTLMTLDEAVEALRIGQTSQVARQSARLLQQMTPLLRFINHKTGLNIDEAVKRIQAYLKSMEK